MIPDTDNLKGTWVSKNFPKYQYNDNLEFTFHFSKYATLYLSKGGNNRTICEGIFSVENMGEENFNIIVNGHIFELPKSTLNAKFYTEQGPSKPCFVLLIPDYGYRYFEKL